MVRSKTALNSGWDGGFPFLFRREVTYVAKLKKQMKLSQQFCPKLYYNGAFPLTWPESMQIYWNKRKRLHNKRVQLPQDFFAGTTTWRQRSIVLENQLYGHRDVM